MTTDTMIDGTWNGAQSRQATGATAAVALLGHDRILAEQITAVVPPPHPLHLQTWCQGDEPLDATQIVAALAADAAAVCIGPDVPRDLAFRVAAAADRDRADMSVIMIAEPTEDLWRDALRAGVRDVIDPHRVDLEIGHIVHRALERAARVRAQWPVATASETQRSGAVIVVVSPKGGSGKTLVASNLASQLAQTAEGSVALVDLDVQFGDAGSALGLVPERSIGQLATVPHIDSTTLKVFLTPHEPSGAFVLTGAESPEEADAVTPAHATRILELLAEDFTHVVVDTPAGLDERTLAALDQATDVVFVATMDVSSIRGLGKEIAVLERLGQLSDPRRHFVLNRADARVGIESADVEAALGMRADAAVPSSRSVPLSMNQGRPIVVDSPSSPIAREIAKIAHRIAGSDDTGRRTRLPWRRK